MNKEELQAKIKELRFTVVDQLAKDILSVQPMDGVDFKALAEDPLAQTLLGNFVARNMRLPNES